jgi:ferric-dicitrate binding protein FerR (iron transport regulator)
VTPQTPSHVPHHWSLLDRYLAGEGTAISDAQVEAWLETSPEARRELEALLDALGPENAEPGRAAVGASFARLLERHEGRIGDPDDCSVDVPARRPVRGTLLRLRALPYTRPASMLTAPIRAVGVALVIAAAVAGIAWHRSPPASHPDLPSTRYATARAQRATIVLPDGSRVTLAPETELRINTAPDRKARELTLIGEAEFDIRHRSGDVFAVRTSHSVTRVLGTRFVVRAYSTDPATRIVVSEGRVKVDATSSAHRPSRASGAILGVGQMAVITDAGELSLTTEAEATEHVAWRDGELVFRNTPLRDVAAELTRAYAVDVTVADTALAKLPVTLSASVATQSLTTILDALAPIVGARYVRTGNSITLSPGRRAVRTARPLLTPKLERSYGL